MSRRITVALVVAAAENGVIGRAGLLPWRLPSDLRRFRALTLGKPVIMGRKTFQSIGRPLPGRDTIVVSRQGPLAVDQDGPLPPQTSVHGVAGLEAALELGQELAAGRAVDEIVIAGGGEIYARALPLADRIYLTRVHARPDGDAYFPHVDPRDWPDPREWKETAREEHVAGPGDDHAWTLIVLQRRE